VAEQRAWDVVSGPGLTALGLASVGALKSGRPDALIQDQYGASFVRAVQAPLSFPLQWPGPEEQVDDQQAMLLHGTRYIGLRTGYDDYLQAAVEAGVRQVVLLAVGVGLDTRAFRLPWPDQVRLFELDQPLVLAFKHDVLQRDGVSARCDCRLFGVDLREEWTGPLREAGFDSTTRRRGSRRVCWPTCRPRPSSCCCSGSMRCRWRVASWRWTGSPTSTAARTRPRWSSSVRALASACRT